MSDIKFSNLKKPLLAVALLKTAPVLMGEDGSGIEGGKSQLGVNQLILEETPGGNVTICTRPKETSMLTSKSASQGQWMFSDFLVNPTRAPQWQWMPSDLIVAVNPINRYIQIVFSVRNILAPREDQVLLLVYSQKLTPSPDILTPQSLNEFQLDINTLEVLGLYDIPATTMFAPPSTRIGTANPAPRSIVSFGVNLDTNSLFYYMKNKESIYLQAALLKRSDFDAGNFERMILSEVDVISFVEMECPEDQQEVVESTEPANEQ